MKALSCHFFLPMTGLFACMCPNMAGRFDFHSRLVKVVVKNIETVVKLPEFGKGLRTSSFIPGRH